MENLEFELVSGRGSLSKRQVLFIIKSIDEGFELQNKHPEIAERRRSGETYQEILEYLNGFRE